MNELKPCPWCGCGDIVETDEEFERDYLYCNDCGAMRVKKYWNDRASPWVRVEDGLPKLYKKVFIFNKNIEGMHMHEMGADIGYLYEKGWSNGWFHVSVTHWMPIPKLMGEE